MRVRVDSNRGTGPVIREVLSPCRSLMPFGVCAGVAASKKQVYKAVLRKLFCRNQLWLIKDL